MHDLEERRRNWLTRTPASAAAGAALAIGLVAWLAKPVTITIGDVTGPIIAGPLVSWHRTSNIRGPGGDRTNTDGLRMGDSAAASFLGDLAEPVYDAGVDDLIEQIDFDTLDSFASGSTPLWDRWGTDGVALYTGTPNQDMADPETAPAAEADSIINITADGRGGSGNALRICYGPDCGPNDRTVTEVWIGPQGVAVESVGSLDGNLPEVGGPWDVLHVTVWFRFTAGADPSSENGSGVKGWMFAFGEEFDRSQRYEFKPATTDNPAGGTQLGHNCGLADTGPWMQWGGGFWENCRTDTLGVTPTYHRNTTNPPGNPVKWTSYNDGEWHRLTAAVHSGSTAASGKGFQVWIDGALVFNSVGFDPMSTDVWGQGVGKWSTGSDIASNDCGGFGCGGMRYALTSPLNGFGFLGTFVNGTAAAAADQFHVWHDDLTAWVEN